MATDGVVPDADCATTGAICAAATAFAAEGLALAVATGTFAPESTVVAPDLEVFENRLKEALGPSAAAISPGIAGSNCGSRGPSAGASAAGAGVGTGWTPKMGAGMDAASDASPAGLTIVGEVALGTATDAGKSTLGVSALKPNAAFTASMTEVTILSNADAIPEKNPTAGCAAPWAKSTEECVGE